MENSTYQTEDEQLEALRRARYTGESLREIGVLVLLFLPLETILQHSDYWFEVSIVSFLAGFGLLLVGIEYQLHADAEETRIKKNGGIV